MSPEYYDFKFQYTLIAEQMNSASHEGLVKVIAIIKQGFASTCRAGTTRKFYFHPNVIANIKALLKTAGIIE